MSSVLVTYDMDNVAVGTGLAPTDPATPIDDPDDCGLRTNQRLPYATGVHCFTLITADDFTPLWITLDLIDGEDAAIHFRKTP